MQEQAKDNDPQTYAILGAAMAVHNELGSGFVEPVYQEAFEVELRLSGIFFEREKLIPIHYKGEVLKCLYRCDFICFGSILVELKAVSKSLPEHEAQVINYLKATGLQRALLINFHGQKLEFKRLVFNYSR